MKKIKAEQVKCPYCNDKHSVMHVCKACDGVGEMVFIYVNNPRIKAVTVFTGETSENG